MEQGVAVWAPVQQGIVTWPTLSVRTSLNPVTSLHEKSSVSVPSGFAPGVAPTAVMFSGQLYHESDLMALAKAYADATGRRQTPALFTVATVR